MKALTRLRNLIIILSSVVFIGIVWLTFDVIIETPNPLIDIDFEHKVDSISGYGTLLGGILSFISILFVILSLIEQRRQIVREEKLKEIEDRDELKDKLHLLNSFLLSMLDGIREQGIVMKQYYLEEQANPSKMNKMYFLANRNFARAVEMDSLSIYKSIRLYLNNDVQWEKTFLNLYNLIDFYKEGLEDLREKYKSQIHYKVKEQRKIAHSMLRLMNMCASLVDNYKSAAPQNYMSYPWVQLVNEFTGEYYGYLQHCEDNDIPSDFREITNEMLKPFLEVAMNFRATHGYDTLGSREIVTQMADIRKHINEIENHCKHYAADIQEQYEKYFMPNNQSIDSLEKIKLKIETAIQN